MDLNQRRLQRAKAQESSKLKAATLFVMIGLMITKITGFLREILIIPKLGYGVTSDAYHIGFIIPDFFYEIIVGGAMVAALTPIMSSAIERGQEKPAWRSFSIFITVMMSILIAVLAIAFLLSPVIVSAINENKEQAVIDLAIPVTRILFAQTILMAMISVTQGILSSYKRFVATAFGSVIYNVAFIVVLVIWGEPSPAGVIRVAYGVVLSALAFFIYQLFLVRGELRFFRPSFNTKDPGFWYFVKLSIPTLISASVLHINVLIMNWFTDQFAGAVTSLRQARTTWLLPYGVFGVAICSVMLPHLTGFYAAKDWKNVRSMFTNSLRQSLFLVSPFTVIFSLMSFETIQALFQWDSSVYTNSDVKITASLLVWFCISMISQTVVNVVTTAFYARKMMKLSLLVGMITVILNPILSYVFTRVLDFGLKGLVISHVIYTSLSAIVLYLLYIFHRREARPYSILPFVVQIVLACLASAFVLWSLNSLPIYPQTKLWQLVWFSLRSLIALLTFYLAGLAFELKEALDLERQLGRMLKKLF